MKEKENIHLKMVENARNLEDCRKELREVLEDWLLLKVRSKEPVPGFAIKIDRRELVRHG